MTRVGFLGASALQPLDLGVVLGKEVGNAVVIVGLKPGDVKAREGMAERKVVHELHRDEGRAEGEEEYLAAEVVVALPDQVQAPELAEYGIKLGGVEG